VTWMPWVLSSLGIVLALITLVRTFVVAGQDQSAKVHEDVTHMQERLSLVEMKLGIFWRMVEENLSGLLKKPTHLEMDALLDKLKAHTITLDECYHLRRLLEATYLTDQTDKAETTNRLVAILVLGAVESLITQMEHVHQ